LSSYQDVGNKLWPEYMAAVYWAMTTLTTVGYGDIIPSSDGERAYATVMMIIGGSFYGFVVGAIASVVSTSDLNASAYIERMDLISAWLDHHQFPMQAKRNLHRYFKAYLSKKAAISETQIFEDLPIELQKEAGEYILHENVKHNPIFDGLGIGCVVQLQSILRKVTLRQGSCIATRGEVGVAMYIVFSGTLDMVIEDESDASSSRGKLQSRNSYLSDRGTKTSLSTSVPRRQKRQIVPGQSFGEEFLLGFAERHEYTVKATDKCELEMIRQDEFLKVFGMIPNALERMRQNALELRPEWSELRPEWGNNSRSRPDDGRSAGPEAQGRPISDTPNRNPTNAIGDAKRFDVAPVVPPPPPANQNPEPPLTVVLPSQVTC